MQNTLILKRALWSAWCAVRQCTRQFLHVEDGFAILMTILVIPPILLLVLALIDFQRAGVYRAELQSVADMVAIAGAQELDGKPDALTRANAAMVGIVNSVKISRFTSSSYSLAYKHGAVSTEVLEALFLPEPTVGQTLNSSFVVAHKTLDPSKAVFVYVRAALPEFNPLTVAFPLNNVIAESVARRHGLRTTAYGPCDLGLFAGNSIIGGNNTNFTNSMTIWSETGIQLGKSISVPSSVLISAPSASDVTNISGGTFVPSDEIECGLDGVARMRQLLAQISPENRELLPDWTSSFPIVQLNTKTKTSSLDSNNAYVTSDDIDLAKRGASDNIVIFSSADVTLGDRYELTDAVIFSTGNIDIGNSAVLKNVTLIAQGDITMGNNVNLGDLENCAARNFGVEIFAAGDIVMKNGYIMCGVYMASGGSVSIKNTSNSKDADIQSVHLEAAQSIEFKNNIEISGDEVLVEGGDDPFTSDYVDTGVIKEVYYSTYVDF